MATFTTICGAGICISKRVWGQSCRFERCDAGRPRVGEEFKRKAREHTAMLKNVVSGVFVGMGLLALFKWSNWNKKTVTTIRIAPTLCDDKVMPSRKEWTAFFKLPSWKSMLRTAMGDLRVRSVGCKGIRGRTGCKFINIRLTRPTGINKQQMEQIRQALYKATHDGQPARVHVSGRWEQCCFEHDNVAFL